MHAYTPVNRLKSIQTVDDCVRQPLPAHAACSRISNRSIRVNEPKHILQSTTQHHEQSDDDITSDERRTGFESGAIDANEFVGCPRPRRQYHLVYQSSRLLSSSLSSFAVRVVALVRVFLYILVYDQSTIDSNCAIFRATKKENCDQCNKMHTSTLT